MKPVIIMSIAKDRVPKAKHKIAKMILDEALKDAEKILTGKPLIEGTGVFGESKEMLPFEILRAGSEIPEGLPKAHRVHELLGKVFLDSILSISMEDYLDVLVLACYGHLLGNYSDEDFRYVYRYSLYHLKEHKKVEGHLHRILLFLSAVHHDKEEGIVRAVREWVRFLGAPLFSPLALAEPSKELGLDLSSGLENEDLRFVDNLRRYSEYLEEAVAGKTYGEVRSASHEWLPEVLSSRLLSIYRKSVYGKAQSRISTEMQVEKAIKAVSEVFKEESFESAKDSYLPVRLQELETPPAPNVVDPVIFEMIPQKLSRDLLPSVVYATKTKRIEIIFLGGPRIGHSGILIKTDTSGVLFDYGLSVSNQQIPEWIPELEMIDSVLVSHAHLDHIGGLPVLYENYSGKWCSVGETGGITMSLLDDALKVGTPFPPRKKDRLDLISRFNQENIRRVAKNHVKLEMGKSSEIGPSIVVTPVEACHIYGSASFVIDIEGIRILYTGDFNTDESVLFPGASLPTDCDVTIFDGTYWAREDFDRAKVMETVSNVIQKHGPVIIPSFAVGRSQEMLTILENLGITKNRNVIIAGLAEHVTKLVGLSGHWSGIKKNKVDLDEEDVLVSGGGMMGGGLSRHHFNEHRDNPNAAVILCGYLAPRTPGWNLLHGYEPHQCKVVNARLSAHSSGTKLMDYVASCKGRKVMVHTPYQESVKGIHIPEPRERMVLST
ncbi:MAG: MBL fold metallo-hydrolase [Candidatus Thorarchaeota archaeon]|nr:MBL fold metallo-hydrolase [Candidatus Thorarchaeota archaeon]